MGSNNWLGGSDKPGYKYRTWDFIIIYRRADNGSISISFEPDVGGGDLFRQQLGGMLRTYGSCSPRAPNISTTLTWNSSPRKFPILHKVPRREQTCNSRANCWRRLRYQWHQRQRFMAELDLLRRQLLDQAQTAQAARIKPIRKLKLVRAPNHSNCSICQGAIRRGMTKLKPRVSHSQT